MDEKRERAPRIVVVNGEHSEEVQRIQVEDEDRLAFRVGVNILTLILIGLAAYVVWRNFLQ